jgi:hypothetical protein
MKHLGENLQENLLKNIQPPFFLCNTHVVYNTVRHISEKTLILRRRLAQAREYSSMD